MTIDQLRELKAELDQLALENAHWIEEDVVDDSTDSARLQDKEN